MKIVFTNGCFDLVHRGHLELLWACKRVSSDAYVVVGLNSDKSVKSLKGDGRPINNESDRRFMLESIKYVDEVILFDEDTPYELIKRLQPDLIMKGGDYEPEEVSGADICPVSIFNCLNKDGVKLSSSSIIEKIQKNVRL